MGRGIRSVWLSHDLQVKALRIRRLETWAAKNENIMAESQVQVLEEVYEKKGPMVRSRSPIPTV